jgi:hypothetical protein
MYTYACVYVCECTYIHTHKYTYIHTHIYACHEWLNARSYHNQDSLRCLYVLLHKDVYLWHPILLKIGARGKQIWNYLRRFNKICFWKFCACVHARSQWTSSIIAGLDPSWATGKLFGSELRITRHTCGWRSASTAHMPEKGTSTCEADRVYASTVASLFKYKLRGA